MKNLEKILRSMHSAIGKTRAVVSSRSPFKVLISTILSQRTRDENTAKASAKLFSKFKTPQELSKTKISEIEKLIKPSGFYKIKAKRIKKISEILCKNYKGKVPSKLEELLKLPGVGRKTASCVLVYAFSKAAIPVDTHVHRISNRLGLVKTKTPEKTEKELEKIVPKKFWLELNELFVKYGQKVCLPRKPRCAVCKVKKYCEHHDSCTLRYGYL